LLQGGGLAFFLATGVANAANFVFHVIMSRMLGPSTYGALGSILGLATVVTLAVTAFQAAVIQSVAEHRSEADQDLRVGRSLRRTGAIGLVLFAAMAAAAPTLRGFLHLSSVVPVLLFGGFVAGTVAALVPQGVLLGRLQFRVVALALALGSVLRLATGPLFVKMGWGLNGAVAAVTVQAAGTLAVLVWPLRAELVPGRGAEFRFRARSALLAVAALGGVSAFIGIDSFLARHYLARVASGYYVAAATAARIALFLPAAIGMLAFPRLAAHGGRGPEARAVLVHALLSVTAVGVLAAAVVAAVPHAVIDVLFGSRYASAAPALRVLAASAAAVGVVTVAVYALLAARSPLSLLAWPSLGAVAAVVALVHDSVTTVAWIVLVVSLALLVASLVAVAGRAGRRASAAPEMLAPVCAPQTSMLGSAR
jgi:O-antigen/teichoic acid export membrane protein